MVDYVLAHTAHDEGGNGAFAAVAHDDKVDFFFLHQVRNHATRYTDADDGCHMEALGNLFLCPFHHSLRFLFHRGKAIPVQVHLHQGIGSFLSCQEYDANDDVIGKYAVWYPSELESSNTQYPVVIFANGTGSTLSTYKPFLTHLSSWGFISVGNDDENTRTGASLEETIKFLIAENEKKDSIFYHKIDLDNIGIAGHSQGGPAVFNMVTNQEHGSMVKALYAASATSSYHTMVMADGWEYDISRVNIPTFLTAGTGSWDAGNATSKEQVTDDKNGVAQGICPLWSL